MDNLNKLKSKYRPEIDGLRAFAVIAVIINHFNKSLLPSGYLGVDIFFVISGYVITSSLSVRKSNNFWEFLIGFYERRIKRLIPALVFFVLTASIFISFFNYDPTITLRTGISSLFGLSNIYLLKQSTNYFAQSTELNLFTHTWSLGVEEQFYFLFPFIIWFSGFGKHSLRGRKNLFIIVLFLVIISLIFYISIYTFDQSATYFLMPTRFWEMATGCLIYLLLEKKGEFLKNIEKISPSLILILIISVMFLPISYAVPSTIMIVCLTSILIACLRENTKLFNFFISKNIVHIGLISYSLYLWHWGVISLSRWTIGIYWWSIPFQVLLIYTLAEFSFKFVESPFRKKTWALRKLLTILKGIIILIFSAISIFTLDKTFKGKLFLGDNSIKFSQEDKITSPIVIDNQNINFGGADCFLESNNEVANEINLDKCILGDLTSAKKRVLIIGNSYSASFASSFVDIYLKNKDYLFILTSSWGASPVKELKNNTPWSKSNIYYWEKVIPSLLSLLKEGDVVFAINDLNYDFEKSKPSMKVKISLLEKGLINFAKDLSKRSINLLVMHNLPYVRESGCDISAFNRQWFNPFGSPCKLPNREDSLKYRKSLDDLFSKLESKKIIKVVDLFDIFCPDKECEFYNKNGILLYRDGVHPSTEASLMSTNKIKKKLIDSFNNR